MAFGVHFGVSLGHSRGNPPPTKHSLQYGVQRFFVFFFRMTLKGGEMLRKGTSINLDEFRRSICKQFS